MTHVEALDLDRLPAHLIVLGGGYVGLELSQAIRRFGSQVTVIETGPQLAGREDADVGAALLELFVDRRHRGFARNRSPTGSRGIRAIGFASASKISRANALSKDRPPGRDRPESQHRGLGLEMTGVELDEHGFIRSTRRLETTSANIWAMGDCARAARSSPMSPLTTSASCTPTSTAAIAPRRIA